MYAHDQHYAPTYGYADAMEVPSFLQDECDCDDCAAGNPCPCDDEAAYGANPGINPYQMTAAPAPRKFRSREEQEAFLTQGRIAAQARARKVRMLSYVAIAGAAVIGGLFAWGAGAATAAMGLSSVAGGAAMIAGFAAGAVGGWMFLGRMLARMV